MPFDQEKGCWRSLRANVRFLMYTMYFICDMPLSRFTTRVIMNSNVHARAGDEPQAQVD